MTKNNDKVPIRSLINDDSAAILKGTFKKDTPPIVTYTAEDFNLLVNIFKQVDIKEDLSLLLVKLTVLNIAKLSNLTEGAVHELLAREGRSSSDLYQFVYCVPFEQVPLYINDKNLGPVAAWRLLIAK